MKRDTFDGKNLRNERKKSLVGKFMPSAQTDSRLYIYPIIVYRRIMSTVMLIDLPMEVLFKIWNHLIFSSKNEMDPRSVDSVFESQSRMVNFPRIKIVNSIEMNSWPCAGLVDRFTPC